MRSSRRSWWQSLLLLCLVVGLIFCSVAGHTDALSTQQSEQLMSIEQRLFAILNYSGKLEGELQTSKSHIEKLQSELAGLREELLNLKGSLEVSGNQIAALLSIIDELETKLDVLSKKFNDSERAWKTAVATASRRTRFWKLVAIVAGVIAVGEGVYLLAK